MRIEILSRLLEFISKNVSTSLHKQITIWYDTHIDGHIRVTVYWDSVVISKIVFHNNDLEDGDNYQAHEFLKSYMTVLDATGATVHAMTITEPLHKTTCQDT